MSLINDALNKVQQQRGEQLVAERMAQAGAPLQPVEIRPKRRTSPLVWVLVNAAVVIVVLAGNRYFFSDKPQTSERATIVTTAPSAPPTPAPDAAHDHAINPATAKSTPVFSAPEIVMPAPVERVTPAPVERVTTAPVERPPISISVPTPAPAPERVASAPMTRPSPFIRTPDPVAEPSGAEVEYDLAGMTGVGNNTLLSIIRRSDGRSFLIPVGKTVGEVTAVSYNADSDDAVIRVRGKLVKVVMRNAAVYFRPAQQ